jgi:hypothetical protein
MKPKIVLTYEFVEFIPEKVKEGTLYISCTHCTAIHKCCCGCSREVVTPLSPTGWQLTFDGKTVSLYPSIGSWSLPCQSHYFITKNKVIWAPKWNNKQIARGRAKEERAKERYYAKMRPPTGVAEAPSDSPPTNTKPQKNLGHRIKN